MQLFFMTWKMKKTFINVKVTSSSIPKTQEVSYLKQDIAQIKTQRGLQ